MKWILVILVHVGPMGQTDSNSLSTVTTFTTEEKCIAAGEKSKKLVAGTVKKLEYVCLEVE